MYRGSSSCFAFGIDCASAECQTAAWIWMDMLVVEPCRGGESQDDIESIYFGRCFAVFI